MIIWKSLPDSSKDVTEEGDPMDLFTWTSIGLDLQIGQANNYKEKSIIKEKIFIHFLYKTIKTSWLRLFSGYYQITQSLLLKIKPLDG